MKQIYHTLKNNLYFNVYRFFKKKKNIFRMTLVGLAMGPGENHNGSSSLAFLLKIPRQWSTLLSSRFGILK